MLVGVVGKPNVGKSTFFKAATLVEAETAPYPFTTIKANEGVGFVRVTDVAKEFNVKSNPKHGYVLKDERFVPVKMLDVAGLVPGAHLGKGLGNKFLDDLRQADVLIHVIDASGSTNEKGEIVKAGSYDPCNDVKFLEDELDYLRKEDKSNGDNYNKERFEYYEENLNSLEPIVVMENPSGTYEVIDGRHRTLFYLLHKIPQIIAWVGKARIEQ